LTDFPEWVTRPVQGKPSRRLWTGIFWDGISSTPDETVILQWLGGHCTCTKASVTKW